MSDLSKATGFGAVADRYDAIRPGYPPAAVAFLEEGLGAAPLDVVDVGAGTGKMTEVVAARGHRVVAVDPDERMLATLAARLPSVRTSVGTGERTGLADASVEVIVCAQAFHWMDPDAAFAEFARIVRPGGAVGIVWNVRDARVPWVGRFNELLGRFGDADMANHPSVPPQHSWPGFADYERLDVDHAQALSVDGLVELAASRSYVLALRPDDRAAFLDDVRAFALGDPDLRGRDVFEQPYTARVFRFRRG